MPPTREQLLRKFRILRTLEFVMPITAIVVGSLLLSRSDPHRYPISWWMIALNWGGLILYFVLYCRVLLASQQTEFALAEYDTPQPKAEEKS